MRNVPFPTGLREGDHHAHTKKNHRRRIRSGLLVAIPAPGFGVGLVEGVPEGTAGIGKTGRPWPTSALPWVTLDGYIAG